MARPGHTYRGRRRNVWRGCGIAWDKLSPTSHVTRLAGDNRKQWIHPFDDTLIKHRPYQSTSKTCRGPVKSPWQRKLRAVTNELRKRVAA